MGAAPIAGRKDRSNMKHEFCEFCGKQLQEEFVFDHYDKDNGEPLYSKYLTCPARRWWNFFVHDRYLIRGGNFGTALQYYTKNYIKEDKE